MASIGAHLIQTLNIPTENYTKFSRMVARSLISKAGVIRMSRNWYYGHPRFFQGLAITLAFITLAIPFGVLTCAGCDLYFGSKIVQILNEGDGGQDGE
jgi:hypothetical protein